MRENLDVLLGIFCFHDLFQIELRYTKTARRIDLGIGQGDATPLQLSGDTNAISPIGTHAARERQHLQECLMALYLMDAGLVYRAQNRNRLAANLHDVYDHLRLPNYLGHTFVW